MTGDIQVEGDHSAVVVGQGELEMARIGQPPVQLQAPAST